MQLQQAQINFNGRLADFFFRGTSAGDQGVVQQIFGNQDYRVDFWPQGKALHAFHEALDPTEQSLIIDAGANIGASAVWFLNVFLGAFVFSVEPDRSNFEVLERNTASYDEKFNFLGAVSCQDEKLVVFDPGLSDWGFRTSEAGGATPVSGQEVAALSPWSILEHRAARGKRPLIFKIDIEGGESRLFDGDTSWLPLFPLVVVELHDWMLPFSGASRNFIRAVAKYDFDFVHRGENIFLFNRELLQPFAAR